MVIRGATRGNGKQLADYLITPAENEAIEILDIRGTVRRGSLRDSLLEMSLTAELTHSDKGLYHAQINPAYSEDKAMSRQDWLNAAAILEDELKLTGQKRAIVLHTKQGRIHAHVVWERYDHVKGKMISDSYSRLAQDRARKTMEKVLRHEKTPERNKHRPEMKKQLSEIWRKAKTGADFIKAAKEAGYTVAWSKSRRPFMVVDKQGRSFDLLRHLDKVRTADVREKLKGNRIPTDKKAIKDRRALQAEKSFAKAQEDMSDRIEKHRMDRMAKEEQKAKVKQKAAEMKAEQRMTKDADQNINKSQEKMRDKKKEFQKSEEKRRETAKAQEPRKEKAAKQETERERRKREFIEAFMSAGNGSKTQEKGFAL